MVIVNGVERNIDYQRCTRCIQDSTVPGISFDSNGVCNFCDLHDSLEKSFPVGSEGKKKLSDIVDKIKSASKGKKYDCVLGISGGRDSTYLLYYAVKELGLKPLAVHFNDGFDNPVAGENIIKATKKLGVDLRTITSDWRETKELKIDLLKASTPDLNLGWEIGMSASLFGVAVDEGIGYNLVGQSFRTEGIKPLSWNFMDGKYLHAVHNKFGTTKLRPWKAADPGFNLDIKELLYYTMYKRIKTVMPLYYVNYIREDVDQLLQQELDWQYPGAHYFDDLYHSLIKYVHRVKFNIDWNMNSDSALVRSNQMSREVAIERSSKIYKIEDPKIIELCIKRLGLTRAQFDEFVDSSPKSFRDYPNNLNLLSIFKYPIKLMASLHLVPKVTYEKYFNCGE